MDLDRLFYPRSIAVVGASPDFVGGKIPFYQILKMCGYPGGLYAVNPRHDEIMGDRSYPSLESLPEVVDLVIMVVPARAARAALASAVGLGVPFVHFFTSGFSETGNPELEAALIAAARKGKTRLVGPNCMGVHCTASRVSFDPTIRQEPPGSVAFLGQSGGVTNNFLRLCHARGVPVNKAVSYGNQIDLTVEDYLEYFSQDPDVKVIAAYIEDVKRGRTFLELLPRIARVRPVIVLKGGATGEGAQAAQSHTGALAGPYELFSAALRQTGCLEVETQEQLVDVAMLAGSEKPPRGPRIGFLGAGGGTSVLFTDLAVRNGLTLPELAPGTRAAIAERIPRVNTSTRNPVDLGAFGFEFPVLIHTLETMARDPGVDVIIPYLPLDFFSMLPDEIMDPGLQALAAAAREAPRPVVAIFYKPAENDPRQEAVRLKCLRAFRAQGLPVYHFLEHAVAAIRCALRWKGPDPGSD